MTIDAMVRRAYSIRSQTKEYETKYDVEDRQYDNNMNNNEAAHADVMNVNDIQSKRKIYQEMNVNDIQSKRKIYQEMNVNFQMPIPMTSIRKQNISCEGGGGKRHTSSNHSSQLKKERIRYDKLSNIDANKVKPYEKLDTRIQTMASCSAIDLKQRNEPQTGIIRLDNVMCETNSHE